MFFYDQKFPFSEDLLLVEPVLLLEVLKQTMPFRSSSKRKNCVQVDDAILLLLGEGYFFLEGEQALKEQAILIVLICPFEFAVVVIDNRKGKALKNLPSLNFSTFFF